MGIKILYTCCTDKTTTPEKMLIKLLSNMKQLCSTNSQQEWQEHLYECLRIYYHTTWSNNNNYNYQRMQVIIGLGDLCEILIIISSIGWNFSLQQPAWLLLICSDDVVPLPSGCLSCIHHTTVVLQRTDYCSKFQDRTLNQDT